MGRGGNTAQASLIPAVALKVAVIVRDCHFPDDRLYHVDSLTWLIRDSRTATLGVTSSLCWLAGGIRTISLKPAGTKLLAGQSVGSIEGPRHFDVVRTPLPGTILEQNVRLGAAPELANRDPYGEGWLIRLGVNELAYEGVELLEPEKAKIKLDEKIRLMGIRCYSAFPEVEMYEIGTECSSVITKLNQTLRERKPGTVVLIVSDEPSTNVEMVRWSKETGNRLLEIKQRDGLFHVLVEKS